MNNKGVILLRTSYWVGAIVDLVAGLIMIFPGLYALFNGLPGFTATPAFRNIAGMGAPLMLGWTALLIWADRKPVERKAILLITLIPIIGNAINQILSVLSGAIEISVAIPQWILQFLLILMFGVSYWIAVKLTKANVRDNEAK